MNSRVVNALFAVALALSAVVLYLPALRHGFVYDDLQYLSSNPHLQGPLGVGQIAWAFTSIYAANWHPVAWLSHILDVALFGFDPAGHHAVSLLWHGANVALLYFVMKSLTGRRWPALVAAALFGLHPLRVESVAWVAERKDLLAAFFGIAAVGAYLRFVRRPGPARYGVMLGLYALSLMGKPMLVTFPLLLLLLDFWPLSRLRPGTGVLRVMREKLPLIALALAAGVMALVAHDEGEAMRTFARYPLGSRLANAAVAYGAYLLGTVRPIGLAVHYPLPHAGYHAWQPLAAAAVLIVLTLLAVRAARRRPYLAMGWLWFLVTLLPVIGIVQVGDQARADRYTYLPSLGLGFAAVWGAADLGRRGRSIRAGLAAAAGAALIALAALTWRQVGYWHDGVSLFSHALQVTVDNDVAENNLATELVAQGRSAEAGPHFSEALRINPRLRADTYFRMANAFASRGRRDEAADAYREALSIDPDHRQAQRSLTRLLAAPPRPR